MSETVENQVPPGETEEQTPPPPPEPQETPPAGDPPPAEPPKEPTADWRDKRIATLTRRLREMQEKPPAAPAATPPAAGVPAQPDQAVIEQRARDLAAIQDFNRRCDAAALDGRKQFGEAEFNGRIANLQKLSDISDPASVQAYNTLLASALETEEAPRLLYELGADLNEAQRILGLSPTRMAVELTKRAARAPTEVSGAPKPLTPLGNRSVSHERIAPDDPDRADHLSTAEWMRRREAQLADRRKAAEA